VKHYKIYRLYENFFISKETFKTFYLTPKETFKTLPQLVTHYNKQDLLIENDQYIKLKSICLLQPHTFDLSREVTEDWETSRKSIHLIKKIGAGEFSEIWEGTWNNTTSVTVKTLKVGTMSAREFLEEAELLKQLSHPNVIQLYAVCTKEEPIYIITELMKYGSLLEYLRGDGCALKFPQLINMGAQIAAGMAYLEEQNCIHRDLAARNILVSEDLVCKVADLAQLVLFLRTNAKLMLEQSFPSSGQLQKLQCIIVSPLNLTFGHLAFCFMS